METKEKILVEMEDTDQTVNEMKKMVNAEQMAKFLLLSDKVIIIPTKIMPRFLARAC